MTDQANGRFYGVDQGGHSLSYEQRRADAEQFVRKVAGDADLSGTAFERAVEQVMRAVPPFGARSLKRPSSDG